MGPDREHFVGKPIESAHAVERIPYVPIFMTPGEGWSIHPTQVAVAYPVSWNNKAYKGWNIRLINGMRALADLPWSKDEAYTPEQIAEFIEDMHSSEFANERCFIVQLLTRAGGILYLVDRKSEWDCNHREDQATIMSYREASEALWGLEPETVLGIDTYIPGDDIVEAVMLNTALTTDRHVIDRSFVSASQRIPEGNLVQRWNR